MPARSTIKPSPAGRTSTRTRVSTGCTDRDDASTRTDLGTVDGLVEDDPDVELVRDRLGDLVDRDLDQLAAHPLGGGVEFGGHAPIFSRILLQPSG